MPLDIHQKLILVALICFAFTFFMERVFPEVVLDSNRKIILQSSEFNLGYWWWHPFPTEWYQKTPFMPATPTLIGIAMLVLVLFVSDKG